MKKTIILLVLFAMAMVMSMAVAGSAGAFGGIDHKEARAYFKDPNFAGGTQACQDCHPFGQGLEVAYGVKEHSILGHTTDNLEDAINLCIVYLAKGKPIARDSSQMKALVEYIKTFYKPEFLEKIQ